MSDINSEMKGLADFAIKSAHDRYNLDLDYSEQSISRLETILEKIYWGFSGRTETESEGGLIYSTASIWGSYLGEFMIKRWGGNWNQKEARPIVSIHNHDFSPIRFVYQKIVGRVTDKVGDYLFDANRIVAPVKNVPVQSAPPLVKQEAPIIQKVAPVVLKEAPVNRKEDSLKQIDTFQVKKGDSRNKTIFGLFGAFTGVVLIFILLGAGYNWIRHNALFSASMDPASSETNILILTSTLTPSPTFTDVPTWTPVPSVTPQPSQTPTYTATSTATSTSTETPTATQTNSPTPTRRRNTFTPSSTPPTYIYPTNTRVPPTPTNTSPPPPPPVVLESCGVNPSTIDAGSNVGLTFSAHFSAAGYGFSTTLDPVFPGAGGCSASADGNGNASCNGSSGMLPSLTSVQVTFHSDVGTCTASYHTP